MNDMISFNNVKNANSNDELLRKVRQYCSEEFVQDYLADIESSLGPDLEQKYAYYRGVVKMVSLGVPEDEAKLWDYDKRCAFSNVCDLCTLKQFENAWRTYGHLVDRKNIQLINTTDVIEKLQILKRPESNVAKYLDNASLDLIRSLPIEKASMVLQEIDTYRCALANFSGIENVLDLVDITEDFIFHETVFDGEKNITIPTLDRKSILVVCLQRRLQKYFKNKYSGFERACNYLTKLDCKECLWISIQVDRKVILVPLYRLLMDSVKLPFTEMEMQLAILESYMYGGNVLYLQFNTSHTCSRCSMPAPLKLNANCLYPAEKVLNEYALRGGMDCDDVNLVASYYWQLLFVADSNCDWNAAFRDTKLLALLQYWQPSWGINATLMHFLHYKVSASFPEGDYNTALFGDGSKLDLFMFINGNSQEAIKILNESDFPNCKFGKE